MGWGSPFKATKKYVAKRTSRAKRAVAKVGSDAKRQTGDLGSTLVKSGEDIASDTKKGAAYWHNEGEKLLGIGGDAPEPIDVVDSRTAPSQSSAKKKVVGSGEQSIGGSISDKSKVTKKTMKRSDVGLGFKKKKKTENSKTGV